MTKTDHIPDSGLFAFDDVIYLFLLALSIIFGSLVRYIQNSQAKRLLSTTLGFCVVLYLSGYHVIHHLLLLSINAVIILYMKRNGEVASFIFSFSYLIFLRSSFYFGIPTPPEFSNTILMIMTLKIVGLSFEIKDLVKTKDHCDNLEPSFFDIIQYSFCYAGVLVGPYYKYRTYHDCFHASCQSNIQHFLFLKKRICIVPFYMLMYLLTDYTFPCSFSSSQELLKVPFILRLFYMTPWFFTFRMKMYIGFVLGECVCINLGLGAYLASTHPKPGAGPTVVAPTVNLEAYAKDGLEYNFETIRCMDECASEFRPTMREGIRYWNLTVQYWLAMYVYKQTKGSKPVKMIATMFVSAIWHGIRLGYYLSLLGTPILLLTEMEVEKSVLHHLNSYQRKIFAVVWYFVKMNMLAYMGVAFLLINVSDTLHYWRSIYFVGHVFMMLLFALAFLKNKFLKPIQSTLPPKKIE